MSGNRIFNRNTKNHLLNYKIIYIEHQLTIKKINML